MSQTPAEIYEAMSATNILVAIVEHQKKVSVPIDIFINAAKKDNNLHVEYDEETSLFTFELKDPIEQQNDNKNAQAESNE